MYSALPSRTIPTILSPKSAKAAQRQDMQVTSDITAKHTEYSVNPMYPFLYPVERDDEARTADWCAASSDATSSVEGTDLQSEQSDQSRLPSQELIYDHSFDPTIVKPEELGLHSPFIVSMPAPQVGFLTLPEPSFLTSSPMQSMSEYGAPLPTFPSAFPPPPPRPFDPTMFPPSTTYYNNNTPTAVPELPSQQHFSPALHYNNSLEPSAYRLPHAGLTSSNWRRSSASNSTMSAPPPPQLLPLPPPKLLMSSPAIVIGGPGHMFRCAKEQLEFDISQHRSPQQPPCTTDAMKVAGESHGHFRNSQFQPIIWTPGKEYLSRSSSRSSSTRPQ